MAKSHILRKYICLVLSIIVFLTSILSAKFAFANESTFIDNEVIETQYVNFNTILASLSIDGIEATCTASIKVKNAYTLKIVMELQKKKSSGYETIKTWTSSKTGTTLTLSETRNINVLCTYRIKATLKAGNETVITYAYK